MYCQSIDELVILLMQLKITDYCFKPYQSTRFHCHMFQISQSAQMTIIYSSLNAPNDDYNTYLTTVIDNYKLRLNKPKIKPTRWISIYEYQTRLQDQLNAPVSINENITTCYQQSPCQLPCLLGSASHLGQTFSSDHFSWSHTIGPIHHSQLKQIHHKLPIPTTLLLLKKSLPELHLGQFLSGYTTC